MGGRDNLYSQIVSLAKIVLPLCALALLSTLFLFARNQPEPTNIDLNKVNEIAREQRLEAPRFSGVTEDGAIIAIDAQSAQPNGDSPDIVSINDIYMKMDNPDGSNLTVSATRGELDGPAKIAHFLDLARVETSTGYIMETNGLIADLNSGIVSSDGLLEIRAPFGTLTAGKVTFQVSRDQTGQQMLFTDGVKLIYNPQDE